MRISNTYNNTKNNRNLEKYINRENLKYMTGPEKVRICLDIYRTFGLVKNIIDLMSDFASEGVEFTHKDPVQQKFWNYWAQKINLLDRCERFMNNILKVGFVAIRRIYQKANVSAPYALQPFSKEIPASYVFINPTQIEIYGNQQEGGIYPFFVIPAQTFTGEQEIDQRLRKGLDPAITKARATGKGRILLDKKLTYIDFYKKDDYQVYPDPYIFAAIPDVAFLEKMRAMDSAAMDGIINMIILWKMGGELKSGKVIWPDINAMEKLDGYLKKAKGGGTVDVLWNAFIDAKIITPEVDKILGGSKYDFIINQILSDFGIPQILVNGSGPGSFSNQFLGAKSLIEKLEYLRERFQSWITNEVQEVMTAMGWTEAPEITFKNMSLRDEATILKLVIQLYDRNILSKESALDYLKERWPHEAERILSEKKDEEKRPELKSMTPYSVKDAALATPEAKGFNSPKNGRPGGSTGKQSVKRDTKAMGASKFKDKEIVQNLIKKIYMSSRSIKRMGKEQKQELQNLTEMLIKA